MNAPGGSSELGRYQKMTAGFIAVLVMADHGSICGQCAWHVLTSRGRFCDDYLASTRAIQIALRLLTEDQRREICELGGRASLDDQPITSKEDGK